MNINDLLKLNVNAHTEKKGNLTYLSWAWAWAEALKADPSATFAVQMFDGSPLCRIGKTALVFVTVTMFGKPLACQLPVMDNRNKAIQDPDAFAVNTAIMRCMTKALALHGLGLYIYAGEDLPSGEEDKSFKDTPKQDAFEALQPEVQDFLRRSMQQVTQAMPDATRAKETLLMALEEWPDEDPAQLKIAAWHLLDAKTRAAIKKVEATT